VKIRNIFLLFSLSILITGCATSTPKRAINDSGMMYGMVYDYDNSPVYGASIFINGRKYIETDLQGRFILKFNKKAEYTIRVVKSSYEIIESVFSYDPMNVLYFRIINASQLLAQAEEAVEQYSYVQAETLLNRAIILEPNRPDILYLLSIVLYFQQRNDEAKAILLKLQSRGINGEHITEFLKILTE
jgi:tetratricopeptide (TPR) repeat protein